MLRRALTQSATPSTIARCVLDQNEKRLEPDASTLPGNTFVSFIDHRHSSIIKPNNISQNFSIANKISGILH